MVPLQHLRAAPAVGKGGRSFDLGGMRWRADGVSPTGPDPREVAYRITFCWNMAEGVPLEAMEAGVIRDFYAAAMALADAVEDTSTCAPLLALGGELRRLYDAHQFHFPAENEAAGGAPDCEDSDGATYSP